MHYQPGSVITPSMVYSSGVKSYLEKLLQTHRVVGFKRVVKGEVFLNQAGSLETAVFENMTEGLVRFILEALPEVKKQTVWDVWE